MDVIDAAYMTVHNPKNGGSQALSVRMGISSPTVLNSKVNGRCDTHHLRLDEAQMLMDITGDYSILQAMAQRAGGVFCQVTASTTDTELLLTAISTSACQGDVMTQICEALKDGRLDAKECKQLSSTIQKSMAMLAALGEQVNSNCDRKSV